MRSCVYFILILALMISFAQAQNNVTTTQEDRIQSLEKVCKQQEEQIQRLQKRLGVLENEDTYKEYTQKIVKEYLKEEPNTEDAAAGIVAGYKDGFFVRNENGDYKLKITGLVQFGLGIFENETFDNNSFYPNGVYINFDFYYKNLVHARVEIDFANTGFEDQFQGGGAGVVVQDAYVEYTPLEAFNLRVGNTHVPFTMAGQYAPNGDIPIWSAPFIASFAHGRDPGLMIHGLLGDMLEYKLSLHNGDGSNTMNVDDDFLAAAQARVYFMGHEKNANTFFHVGAIRSRTENDDNTEITLYTPWGRNLQDLAVQGWKTGVDTGFRFDKDLEGGHNVRVESEFMYMTYERDIAAGRLAYLNVWGWSFGVTGRMCLNPEIAGSGIFPSFAFSYTDVDNQPTDHAGNIPGVKMYTYTFGLGYAFNSHLSVNFNWVMTDIRELKNVNASKDRADGSDDVEHAWFVQFTAAW